MGKTRDKSIALVDRALARRDSAWIALALLLIGVLAAAISLSPARIHHDCALYLHQAELILDGAVPYRDFVDTNPPLIMYVNLPPVVLGRILGISPILAFHLLVVLLLTVSAGEIHALLRKPGIAILPSERGLTLLVWVAVFSLVYWRRETGQREHLFVLLYVPYLFLRIARHQGGSVPRCYAVLLGIQAGLGVSIKPHFLIMALLVEVTLLAAGRWLNSRCKKDSPPTSSTPVLFAPENVALMLVVLGYLAHWLIVPAEMREAFFGRWLPMIREHYEVYDVSYGRIAESIFRSPVAVTGLVATVLAAYAGVRFRFRLRNYLLVFASLAGLGLLMVFVQKKGFGYRAIPFETAAAMALGLLVIQGERTLRRSLRRRSIRLPLTATTFAAGLLLVLLVAWLVATSGTPRRNGPSAVRSLRRIVEERTRPGDPVLFVATSVDPAYPLLVQTNRKPGSRYLCCFPIAFFYAGCEAAGSQAPRYRQWSNAPEPERRFLAELKQDVDRLQPRLIIVPDRPGWLGCPRWFNHFEYLTRSGWAKQGLRSYREVPGPKGWRVLARTAASGQETINTPLPQFSK